MKWPMVKLGEVAPAKPLKVIDLNETDQVLQVTLDHIESNSGRLLKKNYLKISEAGSSTHWFDSRYVLYSKLRPYLNKVLLPDEQGLGTTELVPMLPDPNRLCRKYLAYYLKSQKFVDWVSVQTAGAKMPRVSMNIFWEHEIPLPPLEEQKRIAAILDKADAIRHKRQQAIELADEFLRAVFLDMFGDPVTNPKGWETGKLGTLSSIRRGASPRPIADYLGGDIPWIKIGDGSKGDQVYLYDTKEFVTRQGAEKSVYLDEGALIFANCGVSLGFARILKKAGCIHDGWLAIDNLDHRVSKVFLLKWLNQLTQYFRKIAPDGTQPNLNTGIMKDQDVIVPPIDLQQKYEQILFTHEALLKKLRNSFQDSQVSFNGISQKAFSGEL